MVDKLEGNVDARYCTVINVGGDQNNYYTSFKDNVAGMHVFAFLTQLSDISIIADELRQKIHLWLAAPDPSSNHNDACRKRQATTGEWFINGEEFRQWKSGLNSFIWLHGIRRFYLWHVIFTTAPDWVLTAGSGKSVLW